MIDQIVFPSHFSGPGNFSTPDASVGYRAVVTNLPEFCRFGAYDDGEIVELETWHAMILNLSCPVSSQAPSSTHPTRAVSDLRYGCRQKAGAGEWLLLAMVEVSICAWYPICLGCRTFNYRPETDSRSSNKKPSLAGNQAAGGVNYPECVCSPFTYASLVS